jgi:O-acetyl-ADP-ribose deacetylase (regulator of RNase III)
MTDQRLDANQEIRRTTVGSTVLELVVGNIITEETDAIVNPAQTTLFPGGGVDGEIHLWGGTRIWQECRELNGCKTGDAKITTGGDLQAKYVIHTVGPIWTGGNAGEPDALASCYHRCLEVAAENGLHSIAFPAISTGSYGYPIEQAAEIALRAVIAYLQAHQGLRLVRLVLKGRRAFMLHSAALDKVEAEAGLTASTTAQPGGA